jgi:hypothetical protein
MKQRAGKPERTSSKEGELPVRILRLFLVALILCSAVAWGQTVKVQAKPLTDEDVKLMRQDLQAAKDQIITHSMQFTPSEKSAFGPVYTEYAAQQHGIAAKRLQIITEYAQTLDKMDNAKANELTERMFRIEDETQALRKSFYPRFVKALGAKRAAKFYQVDNRLTMMVNVQLTVEIPLIP